MLKPKEVIKDLQKNDKVRVVHGDKEECLEGYVSDVTENHLIIHEYALDVYRTLTINKVIEVSKLKPRSYLELRPS